ncbi:hypothetical protein O181_118622 [Austropuccinia psidii MF-1]|uniref:Retrotransposon gag domain-containing protein n=1 Tax=Austropuccinia psidii MF-1 TaxID=1389203 RepID=A0A9Q3KDJ2_9BASI|nr:hypothetical protein [Austropuccinia psidii MF-1]
MPVWNRPPDKNTRSQRHKAVLTPTARAPLDRTPSVHQLSANLDRGPPRKEQHPPEEVVIPQWPASRLGEAEDEEGEESEETKVAAALAGAPEVSEAPNLAHSKQPLVSRTEPNFLKVMEKMTQFMGKLTQAVAPRDTSKAPEFKTPAMMALDSFDCTKAYKLRGFIQSCQSIFHNDPEIFLFDRKKVLYSSSFLTGRSGKCIEPYLSNISNEDPSYLLNNLGLFETQLFTLFGDPNEVRKAEQELDNLRIKEGGQVSLYIAYFRSLMSRIGDWGKRPMLMCIGEAWHQDCWTSWLLTLETLIAFKNSWTSIWNWRPDTIRGRRKRVVIKRRSLQSVDPLLQAPSKFIIKEALSQEE